MQDQGGQEEAQKPDAARRGAVALIGFGEAAQAFTAGWQSALPGFAPRAFDIKTDDPLLRDAKRADYARCGAGGSATLAEALEGVDAIFSLVTADQANAAAQAAAACLPAGALFFDCNSCSPGAKRRSQAAIEGAGGRYVDTAVMAPVHPKLHRTPLLVAGSHVDEALALLSVLDMQAKPVEGGVGAASAIKMTRSVMIKGLEALVLECVLTGRANGVEDAVLDSLDASFPGFDWRSRAAYMMERAMTHGIRRAAEMREVALTVDEAGLEGRMARATATWQDEVGGMKLDAAALGTDAARMADAILERIGAAVEKKRA